MPAISPEDHRPLVDPDGYKSAYVRMYVDNVSLTGSNVFELREGGTLVLGSLEGAEGSVKENVITLDGGLIETNLNEVFVKFPIGVGPVKEAVKKAVNLENGTGVLVFNDEMYTLQQATSAVDYLSHPRRGHERQLRRCLYR